MIELVRKLFDGEYSSEEEVDFMLEELENNTHSSISDLLFLPKEELTPEEVVNKALSIKPLITPPPNFQ